MFTTQHSNPNRRIPAAPVITHLHRLTDCGYPPSLIARLAAIETRRVTNLLADNRTDREVFMAQKIAESILAVPIPDTMLVPAVGPVRRLQALVRIGYGFPRLAATTGYERDFLADFALSPPDVVDVDLADTLAGLYDRWHFTSGSDMAARDFGRRHRFAAPLSWAIDSDDEGGHIDDPAATPVGVPPAALRVVPEDFADIVADHRELGHWDEDIAVALGLSHNALSKRLHRAGLGERARGNGTRVTLPPLYGARYSVRLPYAPARALAGATA